MQGKILKNKDQFAFLCGLLVAFAFLSHLIFHSEPLAEGAFLIASILGVIPILTQAVGSLKIKVLSIDVLVSIAVIGAFAIQNYEESAVVTFLFLFGEFLEKRTLQKTRSAIRELTEMVPESALKLTEDGNFESVDIEEIEEGDTLLVKTGAKVPVDGTVLSGEGYLNEASITGESVTIKKEPDSSVYAGTILENGTLQIRADRVGEDTTFGKIIELVEEAQDSKSDAEKIIDRFSKYYTPIVLVIAVVSFLVTKNIEFAITILVLGCPGALVIGVPVSHVAGIGNGAKYGILLKGSEVIRDFSQVDTIIFDKTGTLTTGTPGLSEVTFFTEDKTEVLNKLLSVERESDHPLAQTIVQTFAATKNYDVTHRNVVKGKGIVAEIETQKIAVGNPALMEHEKIPLTIHQKEQIRAYEKQGNSLVLTAIDGKLAALMGIKDDVRPGAKEKLQTLRQAGIPNLIMLSGDNQGTVDLVKNKLELTEAHGNMLPDEKANYVQKKIREGHTVAFVGDGINDSPSIAFAQVGIAMGTGTDVAIETSDIVLMNSDIGRLPHAFLLSKAIVRNMKQNIVIAVGVVLFLLFGLLFGNWMNMTIGMFVHEGSILAVILNGMRLLYFKTKN